MSRTDLESIRAVMEAMPALECDYQHWLWVGMALKDAGGTLAEWDAWSAADTGRYHGGECARKWRGFGKNATESVGAGSVVDYAREKGYSITTPGVKEDYALEWDAEIGAGAGKIATGYTATLPSLRLSAKQMLVKYLDTLFEPGEIVGYCTETYTPEGTDMHVPKKGFYTETAGAIIERIQKSKDLPEAIGDWDKEAGAWIRFNPLDGKGVADSNVTAYRYALVESDKLPVEEAYGIYKELQLPIAALVSSAGKSLHAIVRVEAETYGEYQKRVDFLYETCKKNGLEVDRNNRNPSRLSRLPGATRNGRRQELVAVNIGQPSWSEWQTWIAEQNDSLPEIECLADILKDPPPLADALIEGVLRKGHKALLSGPSKAGKSYLLLELAIAISEGWKWLGWQCAQGNVLYINLELDPATCIDRLRQQYAALGTPAENTGRIDVWHLRGHSMPLNEMVPRLLRRALKRRSKGHPYSCVIIDPIYKVLTGDENAADQMAAFCNQFDKIAAELDTAVIYCHHHSKGYQNQKSSIDRASGSGVFARDPDAIIDMLPLDTSALTEKRVKAAIVEALAKATGEKGHILEAEEEDEARKEAIKVLGLEAVGPIVQEAREATEAHTAWEISTTLREFRNQQPFRIWYKHPLHIMDTKGELKDVLEVGAEKKGKTAQDLENEARARKAATLRAFDTLNMNGKVTLKELGEYLRGTEIPGCRVMTGGSTVTRNWAEEAGLRIVKGVVKKPKEEEEE